MIIPDGTQFTLEGTFDGHAHLRNRMKPTISAMRYSLIDLMAEFGGAIVQPNTSPELTTTQIGREYRTDIDSCIPTGEYLDYVLMYYATDNADLIDLELGIDEGVFGGVKVYPANGSTNSAKAVTDIRKVFRICELLQRKSVEFKRNIPLCLHGETVGRLINPFDAERIFMDTVAPMIRKEFPELPIIFEHVTTEEAVAFVCGDKGPTWATICPQHGLLNQDSLFQSGDENFGTFQRGVRPHLVCWPLLKPEGDRQAILRAMKSGNPRFGLGTDRAWHAWDTTGKLKDHVCGGCYPYQHALAMYAMIFEEIGSFEHFQNFACHNIPVGAYGLRPGKKQVKLLKCAEDPIIMPDLVHGIVKPLMAGERIPWRMVVLK